MKTILLTMLATVAVLSTGFEAYLAYYGKDIVDDCAIIVADASAGTISGFDINTDGRNHVHGICFSGRVSNMRVENNTIYSTALGINAF